MIGSGASLDPPPTLNVWAIAVTPMKRTCSGDLIAVVLALALVGCSSSKGSRAPTRSSSSRPVAAGSPLMQCVDATPGEVPQLRDSSRAMVSWCHHGSTRISADATHTVDLHLRVWACFPVVSYWASVGNGRASSSSYASSSSVRSSPRAADRWIEPGRLSAPTGVGSDTAGPPETLLIGVKPT